jgi:hypothetical protein
MLKEKFEIFLSLTAGFLMTVGCAYTRVPLMDIGIRVLAVMVIFYVIGAVLKWAVIMPTFPDPIIEDIPEEVTEEQTESDE